MNDRVSKKPPSIYIKEEKAMEEYMDESCTLLEALGARPSQDLAHFDANIEVSKPSGMYRFGRAIVNALKPSTLWGDPKTKKTPEASSIVVAEKAWAELKESGFAGCNTTYITDNPNNTLQNAVGGSNGPLQTNVERFLVDNGHRSITKVNINRQSIDSDVKAEFPPVVPERSHTPSSTTARRPKSFLRSPSLHNLRKATSYMQLPSTKTHSISDHPAEHVPEVPPVPIKVQSLRKEPSKKDLAKQQKLSKRVSNLEAQLENARRELQNSMASTNAADHPRETPMRSHRKHFVPGLLPSLPSERLINEKLEALGQDKTLTTKPPVTTSEPTALYDKLIDGQVPRTPQSKVIPEATLEAAAQLERELNESLRDHTSRGKRKSEHVESMMGDDVEHSTTFPPAAVRKRNKSSRPVERPRKANLVPTSSSPLHEESVIPPLPQRLEQTEIANTSGQASHSCTPTLAPPRRSPSKRASSRSALKSALSPTSSKITKPSSRPVYGSKSPLSSLSSSNLNILSPVLENSNTMVDGVVKNASPPTPKRAVSTPYIPKEDFEWPEDVF